MSRCSVAVDSEARRLLTATLVTALLCPVVNQAHGPDVKKKKTPKLDRVLQKARGRAATCRHSASSSVPAPAVRRSLRTG